MRGRSSAGLLILVGLFCVSAILEVSLGSLRIPFDHILPDTWAYFHGGRSPEAVVIGAIRWPRFWVAAFVGAGLATTGAVLQAVFRNSMADPAIIGVSSGAALGAVAVISLGWASTSQWLTPLGAFATGLATVFIVYRLGTIGGRTAVHSLLLSGVAVSSFSSAVVMLLMSLTPYQTALQMMFWLMGGLDGSSWGEAGLVGSMVVVGLIVYLSQARALDILSVGEEQAEGVGVHLQAVKQVVLLVATFVVGACVSVSGVIGFVGLIVPHLMRLWMGPVHRVLIPASALGGATLLMVADIIARMALSPSELNIGIVTSCLGAPFFLFLLRRHYAGGKR